MSTFIGMGVNSTSKEIKETSEKMATLKTKVTELEKTVATITNEKNKAVEKVTELEKTVADLKKKDK